MQTSVRKQSITARFKVANRDAAAKKLLVKASVLDAGKPVLDLGEAVGVELPAGASKPLTLAAPWANPVFWGPGSPKLYTLAVEVTDAESGQRLDLLRERFGFRDCWVENGRIMLNGAPVRLKGSNCGGGGGILPGDDVQWTRGSDGAEDFLDEFGCLAGFYTLGGLGNTPSRHNVERDIFWEIETKNVLAGAAQYVNHPCLIAWDLSNEWLSFLSYGGGDPLFGARRFKAVGDALTAYDPSRWILYDGDGDLHGLWNTFAEHYMIPYTGNARTRRICPTAASGGSWTRISSPDEARSGYNANAVYRSDQKAIMNTENAWKVDGLQPPGLSVVVGEDDVLSPAIDSGRGADRLVLEAERGRASRPGRLDRLQLHDGDRPEPPRAHAAVLHHAAARAPRFQRPEVRRPLLAAQRPARSLRVRFPLEPGGPGRRGRRRRPRRPADAQRRHAARPARLRPAAGRAADALHAPSRPAGRREVRLRRRARHRGLARRGRRRLAPARKIVLFDPAGRTAAVFAKAGIAFTTMDKLAAPEGTPSETVLVFGEDAIEANMAAAAPLGHFVAAGGRIVALRQENLPPGLPVQTTLEKKEWCSILFPRTPQHPLLAGIDAWDLCFWAPDHVVAKGSYSRPDSGSFVSLIDGCSDHDRSGRSATEWVQLMECYRGQGSYLLCQLPLAEKYDVEPMARKMLARLISYAAGEASFRKPTRTLQLVGDPAAATAAKLRDMGVAFRTVEPGAPLEAESPVAGRRGEPAGLLPGARGVEDGAGRRGDDPRARRLAGAAAALGRAGRIAPWK